MSYTFQGRLEKINPNVVFTTSKGESIVKSYITFDNSRTYNDKTYVSKIAFELFGTERAKLAENMTVGAEYSVSFDINSREVGNNIFATLSAFKVEAITRQQPIAASTSSPQSNDGLPF
jgi:hypothetical protein